MADTYTRVMHFDMPDGSGLTCELERFSMEKSEAAAYEVALDRGWQPPPLRKRWWQVWLDIEHPPVLEGVLRHRAGSET